MAINSLETATRFTGELDKELVAKSVTGFFADNNLGAKFIGAKTVQIPSVDFVGLVDYDRDAGFNRAKMTVANEAFTMAMDRGRSIQIDREDEDETGVAGLAGKVMGEFVRTKVVPECDAYNLSKLAGIAKTKSHIVPWTAPTAFSIFLNMEKKIREELGDTDELVCFCSYDALAAIEATKDISRFIVMSEFKKGDITTKVKTINGIALLPVPSARLKTSYDFVKTDSTHNAGGFTPAMDAEDIALLMLPKTGASLVKKSEKMRIFTPDQNLDADAYKFDYRIYYDIFVKKSKIDCIYASTAGK